MSSYRGIEFETFPLTQRFQRIQGVELGRYFLRVVELEELVLERSVIGTAKFSTLRDADLVPPIDKLLELVKVHGPVARRI